MNASLRATPSVGGASRRLRNILSLDDFESAARRHLPRPIFGYVSGGCETDLSLRGNRQAFDEYGFVTRVLQDVSKRSQMTSLFGHAYAAPFGIAPMGLCALSAYRGDLALARAAGDANIAMIVSGTSLIGPGAESHGQGGWLERRCAPWCAMGCRTSRTRRPPAERPSCRGMRRATSVPGII